MKVAIEARALTSRGGGVNRYVHNLIDALEQRSGEVQIFPISDGSKIAHKNGVRVRRYGDIGLSWWLNHQVDHRLQRMTMDVVHYTKADVPRQKTMPTVVTIYDVIPLLMPAGQKISRRWYWPRAFRRAVEQSDRIITISDASKRDIINLLQVEPSKIVVTKLGVDDRLISVENNKQPARPYILFVGTIEPRKNLGALINAFALVCQNIPHQLVIVGKGYQGLKKWLSLARSLNIEERIMWKGFVSDEELGNLYARADIFVWPSVYEGWGFPPQEAMACGTPVIVSNGGALPEVVGDAGEIVQFNCEGLEERIGDIEFVDSLSRRILTVLGDKNRQEQMRDAGKRQARLYDWAGVANKTIDVYRAVS